MATIGVIGLGRMGGSMGRRLLECGFSVVGYDVDDAAAERFVEAGGSTRDSPASVARDADLVVTSLPGPAAVEAAVCDEDGVLSAGAELTLLEASTSDPDTTIALAELAAGEGVTLVDAPVSGGPGPALDGVLTIMVGGVVEDLDPIAQDVLGALSDKAYYLEEVGAGHTVKLLNNLMSMGNLAIAMEAMALGAARGLAPEAVFEVVSNSGGTSAQLRKRAPRVMNRHFEAGFTVGLTRKDLGLALRAADAVDYPMHAASAVHELYTAAGAQGYDDEDACTIAKVFEAYAGEAVESEAEVDETFGGY